MPCSTLKQPSELHDSVLILAGSVAEINASKVLINAGDAVMKASWLRLVPPVLGGVLQATRELGKGYPRLTQYGCTLLGTVTHSISACTVVHHSHRGGGGGGGGGNQIDTWICS